MKKIALAALKVYKHYFSPLLHQILGISGRGCRYLPTCSEFATMHIAKEGLLKGGGKSLLRLFYCQPFAPTLPKLLQN